MAEQRPERLVLVGSVIVDIVLYVDRLPERGGDVVASRSMTTPGGGFNVLSAATRQGLPSAYAGLAGSGPFGAQVREALAQEGVEMLLPGRVDDADTGFTVALVEASGERTFATTVGAEAGLTKEVLASVPVRADDAVYVSGYDLVYPHGPAVADWLSQLPSSAVLLLDPGPLADQIRPDVLDPVLARLDWLSLNVREAGLLTGRDDLAEAVDRLRDRAPRATGLIVRDGPHGCTVAGGSGPARHVPAVQLDPAGVVDTSGAGDVHVGAFLAALGRGEDPARAAAAANAAAAVAVTRWGPATAPVRGEQGGNQAGDAGLLPPDERES